MKFGELKCISAVKRAFGTKFYRGYPRKVPKLLAFKRLIDRFSNSGHTRPLAPPGSPTTSTDDIAAVRNFFKKNKKAHIRMAETRLGMSYGKIWGILRNKLKWKAYRQHRAHVLTDQQKLNRISPDMNPLDFFLWGHTMSHIFRCQPRTLTDMKDMVDDFCRSLDADLIKKVCRSVHSRAKLCLEQEGGHFEHIKNVAKRGLEY